MGNPSQKLKFGVWYDFRNPAQWKRPNDRVYREILDQIVWADKAGFDNVWLSEHHFLEDGYSPSVLPIAAAIAGLTKDIRIGISVALIPFYNPVRFAEDAATVDIISGGRFEFGGGAAYRVDEFDGFNIPIKERHGRTTEAFEIMRRLWEGETLDFEGKYFRFKGIKLGPGPIQQPRPPMWGGGFARVALRRAARLADGYIGIGPMKPAYQMYREALSEAGKPVEKARLAGGHFWMIASADPEKSWEEAADHVIYQLNCYADWAEQAGMPADFREKVVPKPRDRSELKKLGILNVVDVSTAIEMIRAYAAEVPLTHYYSWTVPPGLPPSWVQPHLELFASKVIPAFR